MTPRHSPAGQPGPVTMAANRIPFPDRMPSQADSSTVDALDLSEGLQRGR